MSAKDFSAYSDEELMNIANQPEPGLLEKAGNLAGKFNQFIEGTRLPAFSGGLLQGVGDVGASLGNVIARPLGHPIPHPNLGQYVDNSIPSRAAFGAGELLSQIPLYSSGAGLIGKATGIGEKAGLGGKAVQGAIGGSLMGEDQEGDRLVGAVAGGALPIASAGIKKVAQLRSKNIAHNIINAMKSTEQKYANEFGGIFKKAQERGYAGDYYHIGYDKKLLERAGNKKLLYALEKYNEHPSLEAAHNAQSDLGKYTRSIGKPTQLLERNAKKEANEIASKLREHIIKGLHRSGSPDLAMDYINARHGYKMEYVPYLNSKPINKLLKEELTTKDFAKEIAKDKKFKAKIGQYLHPEIHQRELLTKAAASKVAQNALALALGGSGLYGLAKYLK